MQEELSPWDTWDEQKQADKIRSVEEYRQRQHQLQQQQSQEQEPNTDYFQDMEPALKRQKKVHHELLFVQFVRNNLSLNHHVE